MIYDSHCHIFNGSILEGVALKATPAKSSWFGDFWSWLKELGSSLVDSEKENNQFVLKTLKSNFPNASGYSTVPLMMDIHYMTSTPLQEGQTIESGPLCLCSELRHQVKNLKWLSAKGNCYPFFAVDPRRQGVIEAVLSGQYVTRQAGGFWGVKLYPRLGYHPMSGNLPDLYEYCAAKNIPIITHCSSGGFPPWHTSSGDYCDPENFRTALELNPSLRIDFAHWGHGNAGWGNSILNLMKSYPNVYADLACYTGAVDINDFKKVFWSEEIVRQRTIYGSDYDVFYLTAALMDLDGYIRAFKDGFTTDELNVMMSKTPEAFLGI